MPPTYQNPILPGFYPDPSICRVEKDYYLITSTFEFFPGLPIFQSRDLVHWRQIGHVLNRPSQLNLDGLAPSRGLHAPTIRYHQGQFYVINTLVSEPKTDPSGRSEDGCYNFIVTANDPAGPWSEPYWLADAPGIDPSLLFDDDGRAWYCGNRDPVGGAAYVGHREIWLQELDLERMQLCGPKYSLWDGAVKGNQYAEGPHIYKFEGRYYLMIAEGGTGHHHAVTIARSEKITGPYEVGHINPILTHRHLGREYPIVGTGHADLVETQTGEWWLVCLAMRPYDGYFYNLGRETFLAPVIWEDGWPIVAPAEGRLKFEGPGPNLPAHPWPAAPVCDPFEGAQLGFEWNFLRTPRENFWSLTENPGHLRLKLRPETITRRVCPSFVGRRQQHIDFVASAALNFSPQNQHETAGLVLLQNDNFHFRFIMGLNAAQKPQVSLIRRAAGEDEVLGTRQIQPGRVYFRVQAQGQAYSFWAGNQLDNLQPIQMDVDGRVLSTPVAGGYSGAYIGLYAASSGHPSENYADFDWFEYRGLAG